MFDHNDTSWTARSVIATDPVAEIVFLLSPDYHPDPNALDDVAAVPIQGPAGAAGEVVSLSSADVVGNEQQLIDHYRQVLQLAERYGHSYTQFQHHMWLRLYFAAGEDVIGFAWYDTFAEMTSVFDWLLAAEEGASWSDVDQGWELLIVRKGSYYYFRLGGFDQGDEYANIAMPGEALLASISNLRDRVGLIIQRLSAQIGQDYWTRHRYDLRNDLS